MMMITHFKADEQIVEDKVIPHETLHLLLTQESKHLSCQTHKKDNI